MDQTLHTAAHLPAIEIVKPAASDGQDAWKLVKESAVLDLNSVYCYIMLCDYYADTCALARSDGGEPVGYLSACIPPGKPDTLFVWQIAVARTHRGRGLGTQLLTEVLNRASCAGVRYIEATISPSNTASRSLFHRLAERLKTTVCESEGYSSELFPEGLHEDEKLFRIGPFAVPLNGTVFMPYENFLGEDIDTADVLERYLDDPGSGVDVPAAVILETVQGEGGLNAASADWLRRIEQICRERDILLIIDDIQAGCGRMGSFFSFEEAGLDPDIICLSKSIGGYGLPMALTLLKPELDTWQPGEHNGTFRGNNISFLAATEALGYWQDQTFGRDVTKKAEKIRACLQEIAGKYAKLQPELRGRGMLQGIAFQEEGFAEEVCKAAFRRGLIMETSGPRSEVAKIMPPLTIDEEGLNAGLKIMVESIEEVCQKRGTA